MTAPELSSRGGKPWSRGTRGSAGAHLGREARFGDEGIPTSLPSSVDDIAGRVDVQHKPDDLCTGPITRARAKLLEQLIYK
jgi:hypothetical protein